MPQRLISLILIGLACVALYAAWLLFSPGTKFEGEKKYAYIRSEMREKDDIVKYLVKEGFTNRPRLFIILADRKGYWKKVRPGRYRIEKGTSVFGLLDVLSSGKQEPVNMVINKMRSLQDFAKTISLFIESDSADIMKLLSNADSMKSFGLTPDRWMTSVIPNTYEVYWTSTPSQIIRRLKQEKEKWWQRDNRMEKAKAHGFTPDDIYTIASIVEEETNQEKDKPLVASVYINRLRIGMPLQADPTVRFALKDFTGNRVYISQIRTPHPYNTYTNRGLPPGPICTPSTATIDAVLNSPKTDYIFFVANPDLRGGSIFTTNLADHNKAAREYQDSLTAWMNRKAEKEKAGQPASTK